MAATTAPGMQTQGDSAMVTTSISLSTRIDCVKAAIERIHKADELYRESESDASKTWADIQAALTSLHDAELEFSWQWMNVEVILLRNGI
jgi:hypothetical protein